MISVEQYYNFLVEKFGRIDIKGVKYIASMCNLDLDKAGFNYMSAYKEIGNRYEISAASVERSLRYYIEIIIREKGLDKVCEILKYDIADNKDTLKVSEFIPLLKLRVKQYLEEQSKDCEETDDNSESSNEL